MLQQLLVLLALIGLGGSCKKEDPTPLKPTVFTIQVIYQQSRQAVDSAHVLVLGTKGTYLTGRQFQTFLNSYTNKQGRLEVSLMLPRDYYTTYTAGKLIKIGNRYKSYSVASRQPFTDVVKHEQENNIVAELDTLH
jgi:hypothetical protein